MWFTPMGAPGPYRPMVGIVLGHDDVTGEPKAYIGTAGGTNEAADTKHIAETGAKLTGIDVGHLLHHFTGPKP